VVIALLALLMFSAAVAQAATAAYPVVDSGRWIMSGGNRSIFWRDNQRIFFLGHDRIKVKWGEATPALLSWEIGKETTVYRAGVELFCYRPGHLAFVVWDKAAGTRTAYRGDIAKEESVPGWQGINVIDCDVIDRPPDKSQKLIVKRPLRREHGHLQSNMGLGEATIANAQVLLVPPGGGEGKPLPFGAGEWGHPEYFEFKKAYFMTLGYYDPVRKYQTNMWPTDAVKKAYWLWPDGRTEKVEVPIDVSDLHPTPAGIVYRKFATRKKDGLYLLKPGGERVLILEGYVTRIAVSPNGCRVAFSHAPDESTAWGPTNRMTLKVATVC
jgi:hypothetical protein